MHRDITTSRDHLSEGISMSARLFGSESERGSFERAARERADAPHTATAIVTTVITICTLTIHLKC